MASKQLGKLRQWGRDVISSKEKTVVSEEFKQVERDVDLRRVGIERLQSICSEYHGYLHKKKEYPSVEEGVKMLPIDALGAVMVSHGEEFGQDSAFGQNLVKMGRAHCKIATLQEVFASTLRDTYLASLDEMLEYIAEYSAQRRKLESRRLTYDAAVTKASKAKKEKEIKEAEEEIEIAKNRYEETSTDVRSRMRDIQDNEIRQLHDITELLNLEIDFAMQYLDTLKAAQRDWVDEAQIQRLEKQPEIAAPHAFSHERSMPSISSTSSISKTPVPPRPSSTGSKRASDNDEGKNKQSTIRRRSMTITPPPRPSSRGSVGSSGTAHDVRRRRDSVDSEGASNSKRMNVAGWASSAVSSFSRKDAKKEKIKDKDKSATRAFANLENESDDSHDDEGSLEPESRSRSLSSFGTTALSKMLGQGSRSSSQSNVVSSSSSSFNSFSGNKVSTATSSRRMMYALYDFDGSTDQLSFRAGDEIAVIYEGRDGWSMGELSGQRGLFPTSYVGDVQSRSRPPPLLPPRQGTNLAQRAQIETASEDSVSIISQDSYSNPVVTAGLYDEPFGKLHLAKSPTAFDDINHIHTDEEDEEHRGLFQMPDTPAFFDSPVQPTDNNMRVGNEEGNAVLQVTQQSRQPPALPRRSSTKRAPPPPPPARRSLGSSSTTNSNTTPQVSIPAVSSSSTTFPPPPSIPNRPRSHSRTNSAATTTPDLSVSPFEN